MRNLIWEKAIQLFATHGFAGTSLRDLASAAECGLPTIYHHFGSKEALFREIVCTGFNALLDRLEASLSPKTPPHRLVAQAILLRKKLRPQDKRIYRLALKVSLGFDGSPDMQTFLRTRETAFLRKVLEQALDRQTSDLAEMLFRSAVERIVLLDEPVSETQLRKQIAQALGTQPALRREKATRPPGKLVRSAKTRKNSR